MSINPSPIQPAAFICPLCGERIEAMTMTDTRNAPAPEDWTPNLSLHPSVNAANFATAQNLEANEALIHAHMLSNHTMHEALLALGVARNALFDIHAICHEQASAPDAAVIAGDILEVVERGLAGK